MKAHFADKPTEYSATSVGYIPPEYGESTKYNLEEMYIA